MALATNLVSYWKLDESSGNAADSVGANTLTNTNTVSFAPAFRNNGADFGAANSNKYFTRTSAVITLGGACSISMWVKLETEVGANFFPFFTIVEQTNNTQQCIEYDYNAGTRRMNFCRTKFGVADQNVFSNLTMGTSNWYHFVYTYDGANIIGYVNGASVGTTAASGAGSADPTFTATRLGSDYAASKFLQGLADECGVWSRAITGTEVTQLYNGGLGVGYPFPNFFTFSQTDTTTTTDIVTATKKKIISNLDTVSLVETVTSPTTDKWTRATKHNGSWTNANKS